jgi:hypothetical protein
MNATDPARQAVHDLIQQKYDRKKSGDRRLTLDDVRIDDSRRHRFEVVAAPGWAFDLRRPYGDTAVPEMWADLLAELRRQARNWFKRAKREYVRKVAEHQDYQARLAAGKLTEDEQKMHDWKSSLGVHPTRPPTVPEMPKVRPMHVSNWTPIRYCRTCKDAFYSRGVGTLHYCSPPCLAIGRLNWKKTPRPSRAKKREGRNCAVCGKVFTPKRSDARTCSVKCRVAAHRAALVHATEEK